MFMWMSSNSSRNGNSPAAIALDGVEAAQDHGAVFLADDALGDQHPGVGARAGQVLRRQAFVDADRHIDGLHQGVGLVGKAATP
jgi:hypothetical protein